MENKKVYVICYQKKKTSSVDSVFQVIIIVVGGEIESGFLLLVGYDINKENNIEDEVGIA